PGRFVGYFGDRNLEWSIAVLAIFKAGGVYVPLDPKYPLERLTFMVEDTEPQVMLTYRHLVNDLPPCDAEVLLLDGLDGLDGEQEGSSEQQVGRFDSEVAPDDVAYVIFTSGSTGRPKGAQVQHKGMLNHLLAKVDELAVTAEDKIAQNSSQCVDISVWQLLTGWMIGAETHILPDEVAFVPARQLEAMEQAELTIVETVPSLLRAMVDEVLDREPNKPDLSALRWMIPNGEVLPPDLCRKWLALYPQAWLINAYGPTECSDDVTHHFIIDPPSADVTNVPIGRVIPNMKLYVLDKAHQLVPIGVPGELYIGGIGVGPGYLKNSERTAQAFLPDFITGQAGARLYRTGDLVRYRRDGLLEFLGRIDNQVKIRGFRIEIGEIETVLSKHQSVVENVVVAREIAGEKCLVAYLVMADGATFATAEMRAFAKEKLPEHMVPAAFVVLSEMPLTANGKINRRALPDPEAVSAPEHQEETHKSLCAYVVNGTDVEEEELLTYLRQELPAYMIPSRIVSIASMPLTSNGKIDKAALPAPGKRTRGSQERIAPRTALEAELAAIMQDVLELEQVGVTDDFFELGGNSIKAVFFVSRVNREYGVNLSLRQLFQHPTLEMFSRLLEQTDRHTDSSIQPVAEKEWYATSSAQKRLFLLQELEGPSISYNMPIVLQADRAIDTVRLEAAFSALLARHESLRTRFDMIDGVPMQQVRPSAEFRLTVSEVKPEEIEATIKQLVLPFDLHKDLLFRAGVIRVSDGRDLLLIDMHHIISDGVSLQILQKDMAALYAGVDLPQADVQYKDFAEWQQQLFASDAINRQAHYWLNKFAGELPVLELPTDFTRPTIQSFEGDTFPFALPDELSDQVVQLASEKGTTPYTVLLAVFQVLLAKYSGGEDIIIGAPNAGRTRAELQEMIGFFVNTLVLRSQPSASKTFSQFVTEV
ncbi:MAG: amino acid adenylation domain-containing protein, partial [Tumebacillaceae bacterium]